MKKVIGSVAVSLGLALSASAWAADYPTKSIDVVVPFSAGGGNDTFIRALQPLLEEQFGENLVIRNIAGGGGAVGMTRVAALEPDGYTVLAASNAMLTLEAMGSVSFTRDDFDFIAKVIEEPYVIAVSGDSQYQDLEGLIDAAASGETVQIGVSGIGSSAHIAAVAMANSAGVELNIVPYPGGSETISAVMGGHIEGLVLGGAEFLPVGAVALQIMIWSIPFGWINSLTQYTLIAVDLQRKITLAFVVAVTFNIVTNLIFIPIYGYRAAAVTTIFSEMVLLIPFGLLLQTALGRLDWLDMVWRQAVAGAVMLALMAATWPVSPVLAMLAGGIVYSGVLLALRPLSAAERHMLLPLLPGRLRRLVPSPSV